MKVDIDNFLSQYNDFDIRLTHDARYVDQKCTPDIVCFIADCILSSSCAIKEFTINDLWKENYFIENCRVIFGKPSPTDPSAQNEYNKILCQPLKLLAYAHVLNNTSTNKVLRFKVNDMDMLEYISTKERNAFNFMYKFFMRVISDSGIMRYFDEYRETCDTDTTAARKEIYVKYHRFISANTPSHSKKDVDRIFHKVFNVFAYQNMLPGSNNKTLDWYDLMYNRVNWRDKGSKKKSLTREQAAKAEIEEINKNFYIEYQVNKAIRKVREKQGKTSEVHDELSTGIATEVHHIFPKSKYPELASYFENLILLTSSQHRQKAHPNSNTHIVDREYQLMCLMAKSRTVEDYIAENGEAFYTKKSFVYVVNTGTEQNELEENDSFITIRKYIHEFYNKDSAEAKADNTILLYTDVDDEDKYTKYLPLYSLRAACGKFLHNEDVEIIGWLDVKSIDRSIPVGREYFIVKAVGESMMPDISNGEYCVFQHNVGGSKENATMLFEIPERDVETGGSYTIKQYKRTKVFDPDTNREVLKELKLMPKNLAFEPMVYTEENGNDILPAGVLVGQFKGSIVIK